MYEDLIMGELGSPGLLNAATGSLVTAVPGSYFSSVLNLFKQFFDFTWQLVLVLGSWIRSTPIVMAIIAMLFTGFIVACFFRVYQSV